MIGALFLIESTRVRFRVLEELGEDVLVELDGGTTAVMALATIGRCARRIAGEA